MLEQALEELFCQQAADLPQARASVATAVSQGHAHRRRLRRRRAASATASMLAVAAALAIASSGVFAPAPVAPGRPRGQAHATHPAKILPLAAIPGWLPRGDVLQSASATSLGTLLWGDGPGSYGWELAFYSRGHCSLQAAQVICPADPQLGLPSPYILRMSGPAPAINGRSAYWGADTSEVFQYAPGSWAIARFATDADDTAVIRHLVFGRSVPAIRYPAQLTDVWHGLGLVTADALNSGGSLAAGAWDLGGPGFVSEVPLSPAIAISVDKHQPGTCPLRSPAGWPVTFQATVRGRLVTVRWQELGDQELINGYLVTIRRAVGYPYFQGLCTPYGAGGLDVSINVNGAYPGVTAASLFAHLRLLGPDPRSWTIRPLS
jgi:hypothetical protein